jgi:hypothetical protein
MVVILGSFFEVAFTTFSEGINQRYYRIPVAMKLVSNWKYQGVSLQVLLGCCHLLASASQRH